MHRLLLASLCLWLCSSFVMAGDAPAQLPETQPLTWDDDLADRMMDGLHRFVDRKIEHAVANRQQFWKRDTSSPEAYEKSIAPNRERLKKLIGVVDQRVPVRMEFVSNIHGAQWTTRKILENYENIDRINRRDRTMLDKSTRLTVSRVRWSVLDGVFGEGLLVQSLGSPIGAVIVLPDADQTPEELVKIEKQFVRRLAAMNIVVLIPTLVNRQDTYSGSDLVAFTNQPHREWIWRQSYHMGRHVIGLEVQKVLAAAEWLQRSIGESKPVGVAGYGEGGVVAMYAATVEPKLAACLVGGYFGPHVRPWEEPIYRHVWSQHREFGDAELATLSPRTWLKA